jgi:hypothetical protein
MQNWFNLGVRGAVAYGTGGASEVGQWQKPTAAEV